MKIGLLRHFRTTHCFKKRYNSHEYNTEYERYEESHIVNGDYMDYTEDYGFCYASTAPRAMETAGAVYKRDIIYLDELREVPLYTIFKTKHRLPMRLWHFFNRMGWVFNLKNIPENRAHTTQRAAQFISKLLTSHRESERILVVTHGLFMVSLQAELKKNGFAGKEFIHPVHGGLYEFSSESAGV